MKLQHKYLLACSFATYMSRVYTTSEACEADVRGMNKSCEACEA